MALVALKRLLILLLPQFSLEKNFKNYKMKCENFIKMSLWVTYQFKDIVNLPLFDAPLSQRIMRLS